MSGSSRKTVLVTGASRGIGRTLALAFARREYRVGVNFIRAEAQAVETAAAVVEAGGEPWVLRADVGDAAEVQSMFGRLADRWGRLDVLVNNAGITRDRTILKMSDEEWREVLRADLDGPFWCLRAAAGLMARQKSGSILNVASIVGVRGAVGAANYAAAKAGLIGLTKTAARELGRFNVTVNAILPGFHLTDMGKTAGKHVERILGEHALGRSTDLDELAEFAISIAEQRSASGQVFNFDSRVIG